MEEIHFQGNTYTSKPLNFLLYKPSSSKGDNQLPLIIFLHGGDASGNNLDLVRAVGIPNLIVEGKDFPCLVMAPQLPFSMDKKWAPEFVDEFVSYALRNLPIDKNRIYLTGINVGGTGVWDYSYTYPQKIACAVPIGGWGNPQEVCKMKNIPTWAFHGIDDQIVPLEGSINMTGSLKRCGGEVILTELPNVGHDAWRQTYSYPRLFEWMLSKSTLPSHKTGSVKISDALVAYPMPKALKTITGLCYDTEGNFFGVSEKNTLPVILSFDTTGHVKKLIRVNNAANVSWQDIISPGNGFAYIADTGNEQFKRKSFQIYKAALSDLKAQELVEVKKIEFVVDGVLSFDFKSLFMFENQLYLFGKTANKEIYLIQVPDNTDKIVTATVISHCSSLKEISITSAYLYEPAKLLFILTSDKIRIISLNTINMLDTSPVKLIQLPFQSKNEAITRLPDGKIVFADQRFLGTTDGNIYLLNQDK